MGTEFYNEDDTSPAEGRRHQPHWVSPYLPFGSGLSGRFGVDNAIVPYVRGQGAPGWCGSAEFAAAQSQLCALDPVWCSGRASCAQVAALIESDCTIFPGGPGSPGAAIRTACQCDPSTGTWQGGCQGSIPCGSTAGCLGQGQRCGPGQPACCSGGCQGGLCGGGGGPITQAELTAWDNAFFPGGSYNHDAAAAFCAWTSTMAQSVPALSTALTLAQQAQLFDIIGQSLASTTSPWRQANYALATFNLYATDPSKLPDVMPTLLYFWTPRGVVSAPFMPCPSSSLLLLLGLVGVIGVGLALATSDQSGAG